MPLGYGPLGSTADPTAARAYTRLRGPLLVGQSIEKSGFPLGSTQPPHLVNVSTQGADMLLSVSSTFGASAGGVFVTTSSPAGLVYVTMTSGGDIVAAGSTANAPVGLPGGAQGAALVWNATKNTLAIYDPISSAWLWPHQAASSNVALGGVITWSASSS